MLSQNLEKTLREAYQLATTYKHEFVTLEHLLFSLLEDQDAVSVLKACAVDISNLKDSVEKFIEWKETGNNKNDATRRSVQANHASQ